MESTSLLETLTASIKTIKEGKELSGMHLAHILRAISVLELEPGGPYAYPGETMPQYELNRLIAEFLTLFGVRLQKLGEFLETGSEVGSAEIVRRIREFMQLRVEQLPSTMSERAVDAIDRTMRGNTDRQMTCMPYYMRQALGSRGQTFSDEYIAKLGFENVLFWTAFIVYDDFWDQDEAADPRLLPIANLFTREYIDFFSNLFPEESGFRDFFHKYMDTLDSANSWETESCRMRVVDGMVFVPESLPPYGAYENKFYPAVGHIFGPAAMLVELGYHLDSKEVHAVISYFKQYLIAMQLNDDMHDWKEDLARGHISTVVEMILKEWKHTHPERTTINLSDDLSELEQLFWFRVLEPVCGAILDACRMSRDALTSIDIFEDIKPLEQFILHNEKAAYKALSEQKLSVEFLSAMG